MPILNVNVDQAGLSGVVPRMIYIATNDTLAEVTATGYLNGLISQNIPLSEDMMALVSYKTSPSAPAIQLAFLEVSKSGQDWSLVPAGSPGQVVLPTIANHIATYTNTIGTLSEDAATAINGGNIQAGLSGTAGYFASFPATAARGSLRFQAANNTGNTVTTITNAAHGQATTITIPDPANASARFILSQSTPVQTINTGGLQIIAYGLEIGSATGAGSTSIFIHAPGGSNSFGGFQFGATNNAGPFSVIITNIPHAQNTTYSIPDVGAGSGFIVVSDNPGLTNGNLISGTTEDGKVEDSGIAAADVQLNTNIIAATTGNIGGAGAGPINVAVTGLTAASVVVAVVEASTNPVSVIACTAAADAFNITFSADPGATCTVNYIAFVAAQ